MNGITIQSIIYLSLLVTVYGCVGGGKWSDREPPRPEQYPVTCQNYEGDYPEDIRLDNIRHQMHIASGILGKVGHEFDPGWQQTCLEDPVHPAWLDGFILGHCVSTETFVGSSGNQRFQVIFRAGLLEVFRRCGSQASMGDLATAMQENLFRTRTLE